MASIVHFNFENIFLEPSESKHQHGSNHTHSSERVKYR